MACDAGTHFTIVQLPWIEYIIRFLTCWNHWILSSYVAGWVMLCVFNWSNSYLKMKYPYNSYHSALDFALQAWYALHQVFFLVLLFWFILKVATPQLRPTVRRTTFSVGGYVIWDFMKDVGPLAWSSSPPQGSLTTGSEQRSTFIRIIIMLRVFFSAQSISYVTDWY